MQDVQAARDEAQASVRVISEERQQMKSEWADMFASHDGLKSQISHLSQQLRSSESALAVRIYLADPLARLSRSLLAIEFDVRVQAAQEQARQLEQQVGVERSVNRDLMHRKSETEYQLMEALARLPVAASAPARSSVSAAAVAAPAHMANTAPRVHGSPDHSQMSGARSFPGSTHAPSASSSPVVPQSTAGQPFRGQQATGLAGAHDPRLRASSLQHSEHANRARGLDSAYPSERDAELLHTPASLSSPGASAPYAAHLEGSPNRSDAPGPSKSHVEASLRQQEPARASFESGLLAEQSVSSSVAAAGSEVLLHAVDGCLQQSVAAVLGHETGEEAGDALTMHRGSIPAGMYGQVDSVGV